MCRGVFCPLTSPRLLVALSLPPACGKPLTALLFCLNNNHHPPVPILLRAIDYYHSLPPSLCLLSPPPDHRLLWSFGMPRSLAGVDSSFRRLFLTVGIVGGIDFLSLLALVNGTTLTAFSFICLSFKEGSGGFLFVSAACQ